MRVFLFIFFLGSGCTLLRGAVTTPLLVSSAQPSAAKSPPPVEVTPPKVEAAPQVPSPVVVVEKTVSTKTEIPAVEEETHDENTIEGDGIDDDGEEGEEEVSATDVTQPAPEGPLYTSDISDEKLAEWFLKSPEKLGSVSVGFVEAGRLLNGVQFPKGEGWVVVQPEKAWATQETVDYVQQAVKQLKTRYPEAYDLRVNQISSKEGGWLRPHKSHQNGRDVDLGFYYKNNQMVMVRERERHMDLELNWALVRALITETDVQFILVDKRIIQALKAEALRQGENAEWVESIFKPGPNSLVRHARRHRDHFHVRFFNPRAQELGRRVAPLLAKKPETNVAFHRVRSGDSLSVIASKYGTTINALRNANKLRNNFLRVGMMLTVPLRKACTQCPIPPPVVVPSRSLPPEVPVAVR